jgi:hypothetical protein
MPIDHLNNTRPEKLEKPHGAKGRIYRATLWTVDSGSGDVDTRMGRQRRCASSMTSRSLKGSTSASGKTFPRWRRDNLEKAR